MYLSSVLAISAVMSLALVNAHSNMMVPEPTFEGEYLDNNPAGRIDSSQLNSTYQPWEAAQLTADVLKKTNSKTLRSFVMKYIKLGPNATKECGKAHANGVKQPLPNAVDFPWVHNGPCEIWCDNTRLFFNNDCMGEKVGKVPVDMAKCKGASFIQGMTVATHGGNWEIYVNCAPIQGGTETDVTKALSPSASGDGASADDKTGNDASPAATTKAPTTSTPSASNAVPPTVTSIAPAPSPSAASSTTVPAASKKPVCKCTKRRH